MGVNSLLPSAIIYCSDHQFTLLDASNETGASRRRWDAFCPKNNVADTGTEEPMYEVRIDHLIHCFWHTPSGQAIGSNRARGSLTATVK